MNKLSILVSFRNEEDNITKFIENINSSFLKKKINNYEIIFVDDDSSDKSFKILTSFANNDKKIKIIKMRKRFGHSNSIQAGLENINEENFCVLIDCDLQDSPSLIAENLNFDDKLNTIHFVRKNRDDGFFQKIYSYIAYQILNFISFGKIIKNAGYFKIIPPSTTKKLKLDNEFLPYWNYLITKYSSNNKKVYYTRNKRFSGESKFSFVSLNPWMTYFGGLYYFKYNFILLSIIILISNLFLNNFYDSYFIGILYYITNLSISFNLFFFLIYLYFKSKKKKFKCEYELINFF